MTKLRKILVTIGKNYTPRAEEIMESLGQVDCLDLTQEELEEKIGEYDILSVGLGLQINKDVIDKGKNLKIIATVTTGLDHIDMDYTKGKGIEVLSLRGENEFLDTITGTSELAFGLMINLMRLVPSSFDSVKNYEWDRERFRGHNLREQTLGVVGLGRLGKMMARFGNAFYMKVLAHDPHAEDERFKEFNALKVDFDTLLKESDVISIHVHLNEETEKMFSAKEFAKMKNSAYLVNTSRGKIVNEADLLQAIKNKQIAGYGTDVLADQLDFAKDFSNHPLVEHAKVNDNLIILPHTGGMTYESREATDIFMAKKLKKYLIKN